MVMLVLQSINSLTMPTFFNQTGQYLMVNMRQEQRQMAQLDSLQGKPKPGGDWLARMLAGDPEVRPPIYL